MSHNNKNSALKAVISALFLGALAIPVTANAAVHTPQGRSIVYKTSLSNVDGLEARILDWRNPSLEFTFDASDTDWTDGVELLLSADPMGKVSRRTPLMVQFNNGKPTPVITRGQGFDARIKLDPARIRPRNNKIRFTYDVPAGEECLLPQHGGWRLDFKNSLVIIKARAKVRNFDIREVDARLRNPMTAPKSVRILARGQDTSKLQLLAAQGIGLRMTELPEFKTNSGASSFDIILGRRDQLSGWVTDKKILNGSGPRLLIHEGYPMKVVITGDTNTEVMKTAKAFATYRLPNAHRETTSLGEMAMQPYLDTPNPRVDGTEKLSNFNEGFFENSWGPRPQTLTFDVSDPSVSSGELLLRLAKNKVVSENSRLSVSLNGNSLGYAPLNKSRKSVAFKIPEGSLQGTGNQLSLTPELAVKPGAACNFTQDLPGFYLGDGSKLSINKTASSPVAELSSFMATGGPFSIEKGANTVVILPSKSLRDYNASLKIMAKIAQSSGHGWTEANVLRAANLTAIDSDKNVLIVGPNTALNRRIRDAAPKGLQSALKGQSLSGTSRVASIDRFAASDVDGALELYAQSQAAASRIRNGGVAALYPSPLGTGRVVGVITNVPGRSFSNVASQLIQPTAWNKMEGSVARWDNKKVIMAQTAMSVPGFVLPKTKGTKIGGFEVPSFDWPTLDKIDISAIGAKFNELKFSAASLLGGAKKETVSTQQVVIAPEISSKAKTPAVPELRGFSEIKPASKPSAFKAWAANASTNLSKAWTNLISKDAEQSSYAKSETWGESLKSKFETFTTSEAQSRHEEEQLSALIIMLMAAAAFFFLLLGLAKPSRGAKRRR
ncbi:cellulose biosynthesis cyclic di-GMP-binding regulatory protein BcsB [Hellea balneolensis]|uniref:cellulose biosynthesis cyclic di-GMP-binding regulatory protein BcsB n=1 Tax=Hellea balneolensis TaxID=287478 RepID=UPI0004162AEA|nr:cellulose biosynthesis cyclic di-GMP-binding regulatory protein BcsB [Hellea balneolensis]